MDEETKMLLAALGGLATPVIGAASFLLLRRRRGSRTHARLHFSLRSSERESTETRSDEPPPFPKDDP